MQSLLGAFVRAAGRPVVRSLQTSSITRQKWKILKLNHVAMATLQLEKVASFYRDTLGLQVSEPVPQNEHGVTTVFVDVGNTKFELLLPLGDKSPIANFPGQEQGRRRTPRLPGSRRHRGSRGRPETEGYPHAGREDAHRSAWETGHVSAPKGLRGRSRRAGAGIDSLLLVEFHSLKHFAPL
ncbi:hypothetical protein MRX96_036410 [Rhipicephalus microplus]